MNPTNNRVQAPQTYLTEACGKKGHVANPENIM